LIRYNIHRLIANGEINVADKSERIHRSSIIRILNDWGKNLVTVGSDKKIKRINGVNFRVIISNDLPKVP